VNGSTAGFLRPNIEKPGAVSRAEFFMLPWEEVSVDSKYERLGLPDCRVRR
jgi:hypothetical protein